MSLLYGSSFTGQETSFPNGSAYNFQYLFYENTRLIDASELLLPATTLMGWCYSVMFRDCASLTSVPALPATTLAYGCYSSMFYGCASLTSAPALPATTMTYKCYDYMFYHCTSLIAAPALPATTLADYCYRSMFEGCTSLASAPVLPAVTLVSRCYYFMFRGCTSLSHVTCLATSNINTDYSTSSWLSRVSSIGTFTKAVDVTWPSGIDGIPSGWTVADA